MRMFRTLLLLLTVFACAGFAQQATPAADQATTDDVLQMFKEMHFEQQIANVQTTMVQQMKQVFQNMMQGEEFEKLPAEKKVKLLALMDQSMKDAVNLYPIKEMVTDFAPMYAKYLTKSDIQTITSFYHTPTGQKLLQKSPEITRDAMAVIGPKMQQRLSAYMEEMQKKAIALAKDSEAGENPPPAKPARH